MKDKKIIWRIAEFIGYFLMVICFPLNPLVFLKLVTPCMSLTTTIIGYSVWALGMILVVYPFFYFHKRGGVPRGKSYVHTSKLVTTGLYSVIRHVQYTGGVISIFIATPLIYPHWLFVVLGFPGIYLTYLGMKKEDMVLVERFGEEYEKYMREVPAMNLFLGFYRKISKKI